MRAPRLRAGCFGLVLASVAAAPARGEPCIASLEVTPAEAFVGEQILYRLRVLRREDVASVRWARAPSAPGFRMESLPTRSLPGEERDGRRYLGFEERRALFAVHPGTLEVPPAALHCTLSTPRRTELRLEVPGARLQVRELPERGRPEGFGGVVGRVAVRAFAEPARLTVGGTVRLTVTVGGEANLWGLPAPFGPQHPALAEVDVLARPPRLIRDRDRRLLLRRYFHFDLVPRRAGTLRLPAIEVPYYDPVEHRYAVARSAPLEIAVSDPPVAPADPRPAPPPVADPAGGRAGPVVAGSLALALVAGAIGALLWRRRRDPWRKVAQILERAAAHGDAGRRERALDALALALRTGLERRLPGARALSVEELRSREADDAARTATELLARLERARFSGALVGAPTAEEVRDALEALRRRS